MGLLSNRIEKDSLKPGDHIYSWRTAYAYAHHGIYVGNDTVVHFTTHGQEARRGTKRDLLLSSSAPAWYQCCPTCTPPEEGHGVVSSCLNCFLAGGDLNCFEYGVNLVHFIAKVRGGTCTLADSDPDDEVVQRAFCLLEIGFGCYNVFENNCENFAIFCKTGLLVLAQGTMGQSGQAVSIIGGPLSAVLSTPLRLLSTNVYGMAATAIGVYCFNRYTADIGKRGDVIKVSVDDLKRMLATGILQGIKPPATNDIAATSTTPASHHLVRENTNQGATEEVNSALEQFTNLEPPAFKGTTEPLEAQAWIAEIEKIFELLECSDMQKVTFAAFMLKEKADHWWKSTKKILPEPVTWESFTKAFNEKYFSDLVRDRKRREFTDLFQGSMTVHEYDAKFKELSHFAPYLIPTHKAKKFINGLRSSIRSKLAGFKMNTYSEVLSKALAIEMELEECQKIKDKNKGARPESVQKGKIHTQAFRKRSPAAGSTNKAWLQKKTAGSCQTRGKGACYRCGKLDHQIKDCPSRQFRQPMTRSKEKQKPKVPVGCSPSLSRTPKHS